MLIETLLSFFEEPCTLWLNRWGKRDWSHCCEQHDSGYGGFELAYDRAAYRLMCDQELRDCVDQVMPGMGGVMFLGVRLFGWIFMGRTTKDGY